MKTFKYKLYRTHRTKHIDNMLSEAAYTWNRALALQRRYYALYGKYIPKYTLQNWFVKRVKRKYLNAQVRREILFRLDSAYQLFFNKTSSRPPKFKKAKDFLSISFETYGNGYKIHGNELILSNKLKYKFYKSREYEGKIKRAQIKRTKVGEYFLCIITDTMSTPYRKTHNGASVGIDFGLKTYMTMSDGTELSNPQFLKQELKELQRKSRNFSKTKKGSNNRERKRLELCRLRKRIHNRREDYQWKLAHELCKKYDYIFIEDLNLSGMTRLWGRKMNDLAHGAFVSKLEYVASKYGVTVHKIDRFYPSSKTCECGFVNKNLSLKDRKWVCPECGSINDRDLLAANNILRQGIVELESKSKTSMDASTFVSNNLINRVC